MHKCVSIPVSEHFSIAKIIHPPDSRRRLNSMVITQVHLVLGTIKGHLKCVVLSHNTMPQMSQVLRECAIGMLTAGMSTRAVARELNAHFSTISCLQHCFRTFGSTSNWPHNRRPRATPGPPHLASSPSGSSEGGPCPPRPTHGYTPAQSCEIHRLGPKEFI